MIAGSFDVALVGGGVMGCSTALHLARGGMRVALVERGGLCMQASGRNAGTLTLMFTRASLMPYAIRGREMWQQAPDWLGRDVGFHAQPGLGVALNEDEGEHLRHEMGERRDAGAPIEIIGANRAREIEPALSESVALAAYCPLDGYAYSYKIGAAFHAALVAAGVTIGLGTPVTGIDRDGGAFVLRTPSGQITARRVVLTGGTWLDKMAAWFGLDIPVVCRVNQGTITERLPPFLNTMLEIFGRLSLKQAANGTVLMGTTLHWIDDADLADLQTDRERMIRNLNRVVAWAAKAVPPLGAGRVVRSWTGLEGYLPDNQPMIGPLPGVEGAFAMGCARSGFTMGPYMGRLMADVLLGREPETPLFLPTFDPARLPAMKGDESRLARLEFA